MRLLLLTLLLLLPFIGYTQCEVHIVEGTSIVFDHNPGISFGFEIQNDSDVPYMGGSLGLNWALSGNQDGPIWDFNFLGSGILLPGQSKYIGTPVFDIPLPENVPGNWPWYGGWTGDNYFPPGWALFLDSEPAYDFDGNGTITGNEYCWDYVTDSTQPNGYFNNPSSDGCYNPDGDIFCNDVCNVELVDFDLETGELTIIPYSTYCPNNNSPSFASQYPFDNPYIFGFSLYFLTEEGQGFEVSIGGQQIYESDEPTTINLNSGALNNVLGNLLEAIENNEYCNLTLTIFNLNNSGEPLWLAPDNQSIELLDLCPPLDIVDLSVDTVLYTIGCEFDGVEPEPVPYWIPEIQLTNQGNVPITEWCIKFNILGQINDTICFNTDIIMPGETYIQQWSNVYDWGVLSLHALHVNGVNNNWWQDFGEDDTIANNMYVQIVNYNGECEPEEIPGCTIVQACNYNPLATVNDGSCDFESCVGCMDPDASNYDPEATVNNPNLCVYDILGCTDETAFNYNPFATVDDGSCIPVVIGCMIPIALNYNPDANITCVPIEECCIFPIEGCTDPEATNYNPEANVDDGSCEYIIYIEGCTDPEAINYNIMASYDDGSCVYDPCNGILGATYYAPNTFTPNNDGVNDGWAIVTDPGCWLEWHVLIYSRWGQLIWESHTPGETWPGSYFDGNHYVADGVYFYKITGVGYNSANTFQTTGNITIFR